LRIPERQRVRVVRNARCAGGGKRLPREQEGASMDATRTTTALPPAPQVATRALFDAFLKVGLSGFGGVLPFARRMLVEERMWLNDQEFNEVLSLSQFLPGPNIVNVSVIVGRRFQGPRGALAAVFGLMLMPIVIVLLLATLFAQFAHFNAVRGACNGVTAGASGLVVAVALKMGRTIRGTAWQPGVALAVFVAIGIARQPLLSVLALLVPLSAAFSWWRRR
jgi:chromate transporter